MRVDVSPLPRKLELAFILLWVFLLVAWSAILIGLVFTFRVKIFLSSENIS